MTTMDKSNLTVLDRGDVAGRDSRGLWQQRDNGAWGSLADRMDHFVSSTNAFKALVKVPGYRGLDPTIAARQLQRNSDANYYAPVLARRRRGRRRPDEGPESALLVAGQRFGRLRRRVSGRATRRGQRHWWESDLGEAGQTPQPAKYDLTSTFGDYRPFLPTAKLHKGQNLGAPIGTPNFSVCDGVTIQAGPISDGAVAAVTRPPSIAVAGSRSS